MKKAAHSSSLTKNRWSRGMFVASALFAAGLSGSAFADPNFFVEPIVECVLKKEGADTWLTLWGYRNNTDDGQHVDIGMVGTTQNKFAPVPVDRGQPEFFKKGLHDGVFWTQQPANTSLTWTLELSGGPAKTATADVNSTECTDQFPPDRVSISTKGSLLIFSKVEIKWSLNGQTLLQDTFLDVSNDYPQDMYVQAYFINGDLPVTEQRDPVTGQISRQFEPGWNTSDCRFRLTAGQPHYWSAARGSDKCQSFSVIDSQGPGRPDPETGGSTRVLRGYVVMWAVKFDSTRNIWAEIRWNHLKGDVVIVNYPNGTAWEYNAWSFQSGNVHHGEFTGSPGVLLLNGVEYSDVFSELILDFYKPGSLVLSRQGGGITAAVNTDLTVHPVPVDLRQDNFGPVLTKVVAEVCNESESCQSGTRRCVCCWDQTMLDVWDNNIANAVNLFRSLSTDKGKARLTASDSNDCNFETHCGLEESRRDRLWESDADRIRLPRGENEPMPILGLATKFIAFSGGLTEQSTAGMNLVGGCPPIGCPDTFILYDIATGGSEIRDGDVREQINRPGDSDLKSTASRDRVSDRSSTVRDGVETRPSEETLRRGR